MTRTAITTTKKSEETRTRILEAALALFRKRGFEKTTMRDIAQESGVALGAAFNYFASNRKLMGALSAHIDPQHPLSPFSEETRAIRERDIGFLSAAVVGSKTKISADLEIHLPRVLWLYQMGLLLFWVYDSSAAQTRTRQLFQKSLSIVVNLIKFSSFPLMRPVRKLATDLLEIVYGEEPAVPEVAR
jgi:AcrR family transcriptional regulator